MSREKIGYRDTIRELNEMFPGQGMLGKSEVALFMGVDRKTVTRRGMSQESVQEAANATGRMQYEPNGMVWLVIPGIGYGREE